MDNSADQSQKSLWQKILHEIILVWIMTAYFAAGFGLLLLMQNLLLANQGAEQIGYFGALILALLLGKVVVVVEHLAFVNRFRHRRRVAHIVYSTLVFTVVSLLVGTIEKIVKHLFQGEPFGAAITGVLQDASLPKFLATTIALLVLFGFLFFVREVGMILGPGVLRKEMFRRPEAG